MQLEELEEALGEIIEGDFTIEVNKKGFVVIVTSLRKDEDGELVSDEDDSDEDDESIDSDVESLDALDEDDD